VCVCVNILYAHVCAMKREKCSQKAGGGSRTKRDGEQVGGREDAKCEGVKTGNPVTMRSAGDWGLLDLFEDQEEDIEEARETQTVVGRESDGSRPARARWDAPLSPLSLSIVRAVSIGVPWHSSPTGSQPRRLATIAAIQDRRTLAPAEPTDLSEYLLYKYNF